MDGVFSTSDVQRLGLKFARVMLTTKSEARLAEDFHSHYGSSAFVLADQWEDICNHGDPPLEDTWKSEKGLKRFLMAHFWLWAKPKNACVFSPHFQICEDYCCGKPFWIWLKRIASLSKIKIVFDPSLLDPSAPVFGFSTDGVDFGMWEKQNPEFPLDRQAMSHKMKRCAVKYLVLLSTAASKCLQIVGPEWGGNSDSMMLKDSGIMEKLKEAEKVCNVDLGFKMEDKGVEMYLSFPDYMDESKLHQFKTRIRLRQETFNARLKYFRSLSEIFQYGKDKHKIVMYAVATTVQYQMDNGSPLFDV